MPMLASTVSGPARPHWGLLRLFQKSDDLVALVDVNDPEVPSILMRYLEAGDGHIRARLHMLLQHWLVVHLINMVPRQQHDNLGP